MSTFPDNFTKKTRPLPADKLDEASTQAVRQLAAEGYEVHTGLTPEFAAQVLTMSQEPDIHEFCPNDSTKRFASPAVTQQWLSKKRGFFLLLKRSDEGLKLVGYGWAGPASSQNAPSGRVTFAIRIGKAGQGKGLATPFARLIVTGSAVLYGARDMWLETWASNAAAVHIYHKIGFETVVKEPGKRLTQTGQKISDTRVYMSLPNELLPKPQ